MSEQPDLLPLHWQWMQRVTTVGHSSSVKYRFPPNLEDYWSAEDRCYQTPGGRFYGKVIACSPPDHADPPKASHFFGLDESLLAIKRCHAELDRLQRYITSR